MDIVPWKQDLYGDEYGDLPMPPKIVEWDDET